MGQDNIWGESGYFCRTFLYGLLADGCEMSKTASPSFFGKIGVRSRPICRCRPSRSLV